MLAEVLKGERVSDFHDLSELPETKMRSKRLVTTGGHYAFLKISEGCNKRCTYCIIPTVRGPYRSVPMEQLLAEARELADQGVKELILVAQETTLYGMDLYGEKTLPELLHEAGTDRRHPVDPYPVLLSGGDHRGADSGDEGRAEKSVIIWIFRSSMRPMRILKRMGRRTTQAELAGYRIATAAGGDPGYLHCARP